VNDKKDRPKVEWIEDRVFERDGIVVVVNKLPLWRPRYSLSVGFRRADRDETDRPGRFFSIWSQGQGKIKISRMAGVLFELSTEAEDYVSGELQRLEDDRTDQVRAREQRGMDRGKTKPLQGLSGGPGSGKTARKRANKQKRREAS